MTPQDLTTARRALGLKASELGRRLELEGRDPGQQVLRWEAGKAAIPGPARVAVRYMLAEHAEHAKPAQAAPLAAPEPTPEPIPAEPKTRRRG